MSPRGTWDDPVVTVDVRHAPPRTRLGRGIQIVGAICAGIGAAAALLAIGILVIGTLVAVVLDLIGVL